MLVRQFVSAIAGRGGVGKSTLALTIALSMVTGRKLLHQGPHGGRILKVWVINLEDPAEELDRRLMALMLHHKIAPSEIEGRLYLDTGRQRPICVARSGLEAGFIATADVDGLIAEIKANGIDALIIDPFVKVHEVDENSNKAIDFAVAQFARVADETNCAVLLVPHFRKGSAQGDLVDMVRGARSLIDATRATFTMSSMTTEEAKQFQVSEADRKRLVRLDDGKLNLTPAADRASWFELIDVSIGNGDDDYPAGDRVQTIDVWTPPSIWASLTPPIINDILDKVDAGMDDGERYSKRAQDEVRYVGQLITEMAELTDDRAKPVVSSWLENGVLVEIEYESKSQRKTRKGLKVGTRPCQGSLEVC